MTIDLSGHSVVVSGAANGIGRAIAMAFLDAGCSVLAIDLDRDGLNDLQSMQPDRVEMFCGDISDYEWLKGCAGKREIDHLVCAAAKGSGVGGFPFWNLSPDDWRQVIDVTLMGTVNLMHAFVPGLLQGEPTRKTVVMLSSVAGQIGSPTDPPYSASKAAIINFAQVAAKDLAKPGVRVNVISPGMVNTSLNRSVFEASEASGKMSYADWAEEKIKRIAPLGRWQEPGEFGAMAVFLASPHAINITGQTINIDGGQVMHS